ncbi:MAG TPA: FAD-dependent oxidoreductase [Alphaproteobacteria bacterium]
MSNYDLIIVGAGAAGLGAALEASDLAQTDGKPRPKILVLEALNRLGGRMKTESFGPGYTFDLGGSWLHGGLINVFHKWASDRYAGKYNYNVDKVENPIVLTDHGTYDGSFTAEQSTRFEELWNDHQCEYPGTDTSFLELYNRIPLDQRTQKDADYIRAVAKLWMAAMAPQNVSAREYFEDPYATGGVMIKGGMQMLVKLMADEARHRDVTFLNGAVAKSVDQAQDGVTVNLEDGRVFTAAKAIVTVASEVLKKKAVTLGVNVPAELENALEGTQPAHYAKVILPLEPGYLDSLGYHSDCRITDLRKGQDKTILIRSNGNQALIKMIGGQDALDVEHMIIRDVETKFIEEIQSTGYFKHFGKHVMVGPVQITDWNSHPFFGQAYSVKKPGYNRDGVISFGRIGVAGEAFSLAQDGGAQISGAHQSGVRLIRKMYTPN